MNELDLVKTLIPELLSGSSPVYGARLKQLLNTALIARGFSTFNEKQFGFKKFSEFLEDAFSEVVKLEPPLGAGDILVSLRAGSQTNFYTQPSLASLSASAATPIVRSDIWQAFANPDENRKRFVKKATKEIVHFLENGGSEWEGQVNSSPEDFIEIVPVSAQTQREWMQAFIEQKRLSTNEREALETLIQGKYSSSLNAAFTRALGVNGLAWREFRTGKITQMIQAWAKEHVISFSDFCIAQAASNRVNKPLETNQTLKTPREQAIHLLALLSDEDISRVVLPTILNTLLLRAKY